ncbi:unnamed protein product [Urochloa humidicola]
MHLRNGFEEEFPGDTWNELTEKVASSLSLSVVSLASFLAGEKTRFFACTGVIIGHIKSMTKILTSASLVTVDKKIDENLKVCTANHCVPLACLFHLLIPTLSFIADSGVTSY